MPLTRETFVGPWAGLPVAWTADNRFDEPTYRADVARCCQAGMPGIYTAGTSGEFYAMELDEYRAVAKATVEECRRHGTPVMIGCTSTYTLGALRRVAIAAELGADAVQLALPFWLAMDDRQIVPFFREVGKAAAPMALSIYESTRAKKVLTVDQHRAIHDAAPNYLMVKANAGTIGQTVEGCRDLSKFINVFAGETKWLELGPHGVRGSCSAMVYWNPKVTLSMWKMVAEKRWKELEPLAELTQQLHEFLGGHFGPKGLTDSAFDRLGGVTCGFLGTSLQCRAPYAHANEHDVQIMRQWYRDHFPQMLVQ